MSRGVVLDENGIERPRIRFGGHDIKCILEWKKLPNIKDERVTKSRYFNSYGYEIQRPDGNFEIICGKDAYIRTIEFLKDIDKG